MNDKNENEWLELASNIKPLKKVAEPIAKPLRDIIIHPRNTPIVENYNKKEIPNLNKNEFKRISSGYYPLEMKLDMHGMYQDEAERYLITSIKKAYEQGIKRVLIVTGRGTVEHPSVIKENLPIWIKSNQIINIITGFSHASATDGGAGAFYITLKINPRFK